MENLIWKPARTEQPTTNKNCVVYKIEINDSGRKCPEIGVAYYLSGVWRDYITMQEPCNVVFWCELPDMPRNNWEETDYAIKNYVEPC